MSNAMKTISIAVSISDYEAFRRAAKQQNRPIAQLIRDAMVEYRANTLASKTRLTQIPVLAGHRPVGSLPARLDVYDEVFSDEKDP